MFKLIVKLALAALVINAAWHAGSAYATYYQFRDSVRQAALAGGQTEEQLRQRILELAATHRIPMAEDGFSIRREQRQVFVRGSYEQKVPVAPGFEYPWRFSLDIDAYTIELPPGPGL